MDYEQVNISPLSARETHVVDAASHSAVQSPSTMTHAPIMVDSVIPTVMKMNNEYWLIGIIIVLIMVVIMLIVYIVKIKNASENEPKRTQAQAQAQPSGRERIANASPGSVDQRKLTHPDETETRAVTDVPQSGVDSAAHDTTLTRRQAAGATRPTRPSVVFVEEPSQQVSPEDLREVAQRTFVPRSQARARDASKGADPSDATRTRSTAQQPSVSTTTVTRVVEDDTSAEVVVDAPAATIVTTDVDDQQGQSHPAVEVMPASIVEQAQTSME